MRVTIVFPTRLALVLLVAAGIAFAQPASPFEIKFILHSRDGFGPHVTASDLRLKQGKQNFHFTLDQPVAGQHGSAKASVPTRLLVILGPELASNPDALADTLNRLKPIWPLGWEVAVVRPDGYTTPYTAAEGALQQSLNTPPANPSETPESVGIDATDRLHDFPGRRLVLYVGIPDASDHRQVSEPLRTINRTAFHELAKIYILDGGSPSDVSAARRVGEGAQFGFSPRRSSDGATVFHAMTLHDAISNMIGSAHEYFVLTVQCAPGTCPNPQIPLALELLDKSFAGILISDGVGSAQHIKLQVKSE